MATGPVKVAKVTSATGAASLEAQERYYLASQWTLIRQRFSRHRLAMVGIVILALFYLMAIFAEFMAPYEVKTRFEDMEYHPPT